MLLSALLFCPIVQHRYGVMVIPNIYTLIFFVWISEKNC